MERLQRVQCERCGVDSPFVTGIQRIWFCDDCKDKHEIMFEGVLLKFDTSSEIKPGDAYLAKCNTGWRLLTCKVNNLEEGYIVPVEENAYYYNTHECYKLE